MSAPRIYREIIQGSEQWLKLRSGIPTSSEFDKIVTPGGKPSKSAEGYMYTLLAERVKGRPCRQFMSDMMKRGNWIEPDAIEFYEFTRDVKTVRVGFMTNAEGTIGASPDLLVGDDGQVEIKSPGKEEIHMSYLLGSGSPYEKHKVQMQGQLWISGRRFNDSMSFDPDLPPAIMRIERDEPFIAIIERLVTTFSLELERQYQLPRDFLEGRSLASLTADQKQAASDDWSKPLPSPREAMKELLRNAK